MYYFADNKKPFLRISISLGLSFLLVCLMTWAMLNMESGMIPKEDKVELRELDAFVPPPPPPPPPIKMEMEPVSQSIPSVNLLANSEGPKLSFSDNPNLSFGNLEKVTVPKFNLNDLDLRKNLTLDFPLFDVQELDEKPRLVSSNHIKFPTELQERGIYKVNTKVEIIIDKNGRAYVKKIVDPVYPEMISVIRKAINNSKFTIPMKDGRPVQAVYLYSLNFVLRI